MPKRKSYSPAFKAQVALAALKGDRTVNELAGQYGVHPTLIHDWKRRRLMRLMGLEAIHPKPRLSANSGHKVYPYLLRGVAVERAGQVWGADITYVPLARGFMYLAATIDWVTVHPGCGTGRNETGGRSAGGYSLHCTLPHTPP